MPKANLVFYLDHERHIPRTIDEILELILPIPDLHLVRFWSPELGRSISIFEIPAVSRHLGLPERRPRAALAGTATIRAPQAQMAVSTTSISTGGVGVRVGEKMALAGEVMLAVSGLGLSRIGPVKASVLYRHGTIVGLKFDDLSDAEKEKIEDFIHGRRIESPSV